MRPKENWRLCRARPPSFWSNHRPRNPCKLSNQLAERSLDRGDDESRVSSHGVRLESHDGRVYTAAIAKPGASKSRVPEKCPRCLPPTWRALRSHNRRTLAFVCSTVFATCSRRTTLARTCSAWPARCGPVGSTCWAASPAAGCRFGLHGTLDESKRPTHITTTLRVSAVRVARVGADPH